MRSRYARYAAGLLLVAWVAFAVPVETVTNGQPDGNNHPYVGLAIQFIPSMPGFITICSGSALSPTVFLTAAHCFDPAQPVLVTYKAAPPYSLAADFTVGTFYPDPAWCFGCGSGLAGADTHDVALVTLASPRDPGGFAALPEAGLVDTLAMNTQVDVVGYGTNGFLRGGGPPQNLILLARFYAPTQLIQASDVRTAEFLKLTANPAQGKGGSCFGDSGGPDLLGGTNTILGVNSFGTNGNCAGLSYSQRVDLPDILAFIEQFMTS